MHTNLFTQCDNTAGTCDDFRDFHDQVVGHSHKSCQGQMVGESHTLMRQKWQRHSMDSLHKRLRTLREQSTLSQADVAAAVDIDRSTLSKYETGGDMPGRETLVKLARFYKVSVDWLAASSGVVLEPDSSVAKSEQEKLMLWAFRTLPKDEADAHLNLLVSRARSIGPTS